MREASCIAGGSAVQAILLAAWYSVLLGVQAAVRPFSHHPEPAFTCRSAATASDEVACRERRALDMSCRDAESCSGTDLSPLSVAMPRTGNHLTTRTCADWQAARRIGMTCARFPFYNGGWPLRRDVAWQSHWEHYDCVTVGDGGYCAQWNVRESGHDEEDAAAFTCTSTNVTTGSHTFCDAWQSSLPTMDGCAASYECWPDCEHPTRCLKRCCSGARCWDCSYGVAGKHELFVQGRCDEVDPGGACLRWTQQTYDLLRDAWIEHETFECAEVSPTGRFCVAWRGEADSPARFELVSCVCVSDQHDAETMTNVSTTCPAWTCYERGLPYFYPNVFWGLLPFSVSFPASCWALLLQQRAALLQHCAGPRSACVSRACAVRLLSTAACSVNCVLSVVAAYLGGGFALMVNVCLTTVTVCIYSCVLMLQADNPQRPLVPTPASDSIQDQEPSTDM